MTDTELRPERVVLAGVHTGCRDSLTDTTDESMAELAQLCETAGAVVEGIFIQNKTAIETATYIGSGKIEEIAEFCQREEIDTVIFDDELTGTQIRNLEREIGVSAVRDRSALILHIFAQRAQTREGKIQVELAQLKYYLPRLSGSSSSLSRQQGGISAMRGPGETKLETDRRHIRRRIASLSRQLREVAENRRERRRAREKDNVTQVALIGYTNAGKSTLMNYLTGAGVLSEDKLFATLDPTARKLVLPKGEEVLLTDTVGFIRKLPHHLIKAFHSTLEEAMSADLLLHVADAASPEGETQVEVVHRLIRELGGEDKPIVTALNKIDLLAEGAPLPRYENCCEISAKTGEGIEEMLERIEKTLPAQRRKMSLLIPYSRGGALQTAYSSGQVLSEEHTAEGIRLEIIADPTGYGRLEEFLSGGDTVV